MKVPVLRIGYNKFICDDSSILYGIVEALEDCNEVSSDYINGSYRYSLREKKDLAEITVLLVDREDFKPVSDTEHLEQKIKELEGSKVYSNSQIAKMEKEIKCLKNEIKEMTGGDVDG